jgi:hypothetical protein
VHAETPHTADRDDRVFDTGLERILNSLVDDPPRDGPR